MTLESLELDSLAANAFGCFRESAKVEESGNTDSELSRHGIVDLSLNDSWLLVEERSYWGVGDRKP